MVRHETRCEYNHWRKILRRGQEKVRRRARDPNGLARLLAENQPERAIPHHLRPSNMAAEKAVGSTAGRLPACLSDISHDPTRQRPGISFLDLPLEIRTLVYQECVDYPTSRSMFDTYYTPQGEPKTSSKRPSAIKAAIRLHTPTVFLLCKQISCEALGLLRTRQLIIDQIPPWVFGHTRPLPLDYFISSPTLQKVKYIELRVALGEGSQGSGHVWIEILGDLLEALAPLNSVIQLRVMAKLSHVDHTAVWNIELQLYELMVQMATETLSYARTQIRFFGPAVSWSTFDSTCTSPKANGRYVLLAENPPTGGNAKCQLLVAFHQSLGCCFPWYSIVLLPSKFSTSVSASSTRLIHVEDVRRYSSTVLPAVIQIDTQPR